MSVSTILLAKFAFFRWHILSKLWYICTYQDFTQGFCWGGLMVKAVVACVRTPTHVLACTPSRGSGDFLHLLKLLLL